MTCNSYLKICIIPFQNISLFLHLLEKDNRHITPRINALQFCRLQAHVLLHAAKTINTIGGKA